MHRLKSPQRGSAARRLFSVFFLSEILTNAPDNSCISVWLCSESYSPGLVHADAGNVHFWHKADSVSCLTYRVPISQKYQFHFPVRQL